MTFCHVVIPIFLKHNLYTQLNAITSTRNAELARKHWFDIFPFILWQLYAETLHKIYIEIWFNNLSKSNLTIKLKLLLYYAYLSLTLVFQFI